MNQQRMAPFLQSMRTFYLDGTFCYRTAMLSNSADTLRQPDLARTLREIASGGADSFYRGRAAELIARDIEANGGLITCEDMAGYRTRFSDKPIRGSYRGLEVIGDWRTRAFRPQIIGRF